MVDQTPTTRGSERGPNASRAPAAAGSEFRARAAHPNCFRRTEITTTDPSGAMPNDSAMKSVVNPASFRRVALVSWPTTKSCTKMPETPSGPAAAKAIAFPSGIQRMRP